MSEKPKLIACPCCGYKAITEEYDICSVCFWEHDLAQESFPDWVAGPNSVSLREAQQNFMRFRACDRESISAVQSIGPEDVRDPDWKPVPPLAEGQEPITPDTVLKTKGVYCECCGYRTILSFGDLCLVCLWRYEGGPIPPPIKKAHETVSESWGPVSMYNDVTLQEAQQNYHAFGKCSPRYRELPTRPASNYDHNPNWNPAPATEDSCTPMRKTDVLLPLTARKKMTAKRQDHDMEAVNIGKNFYKYVLTENLWPGRIEDIVTFVKGAHQFANSPPPESMISERIRFGHRERVVMNPNTGDFAVMAIDGPEAEAIKVFFAKRGTRESRKSYLEWHSSAIERSPYPQLLTCECCGYRSITQEFEICDVCLWTHDEYQIAHPDDSGANGDLTLRQAQQNFALSGKCSPKYNDLDRIPGPDDERDPKWKPLPEDS